MIRLYLGGERSGKSDLALERFMAGPGSGIMLATGRPLDMEFRERVMAHRLARPADIPMAEAGADLPEKILDLAGQGRAKILVDSLDFWLFTCLEHGADADERRQAFIRALEQARDLDVTLVSCEVGLGPVAADALTRRFVRRMGGLNRAVAAVCDEVWLVVAGQALALKTAGKQRGE